VLALLVALLLSACQRAAGPAPAPAASGTANTPGLRVLAVETFLADIAQNVAGDRVRIDALIPIGVDPHGFEPTPADVRKVADSTLLIANGAGFESFLGKLLENTGGQRQLLEAAAGLTSRTAREGEEAADGHHDAGDPHFWLDPVNVITYTGNIRDGLSRADPRGADTYARNADAYIARLKDLDAWISEQVRQIPAERRLLVTNHESFGYFADRYGFRIVGTVIPSVSTGASPSAQQLARLTDHIKASGAPAIFIVTGASPQLAGQLGQEVGVKVVTALYPHSTTEAGGPAPTYSDMMKFDVKAIVDALR
jgi:ABC-type Zn uptake system ZnuABC Zn-binding protein ZnuA